MIRHTEFPDDYVTQMFQLAWQKIASFFPSVLGLLLVESDAKIARRVLHGIGLRRNLSKHAPFFITAAPPILLLIKSDKFYAIYWTVSFSFLFISKFPDAAEIVSDTWKF